MAKEIKFSLLYRDMWQSGGKYVPRVDQLKRIAYLESYSTYQEIKSDCEGKIEVIHFHQGDVVEKGDVVASIRKTQ